MLQQILVFITFLGLVQCSAIKTSTRLGGDNTYTAFTPAFSRIGEVVFSSDSLKEALDVGANVAIIVHGHGPSIDDFTKYQDMKYAILGHEDWNVIIVDWSRYANADYSFASGAVPSIGLGLSEFIRQLVIAEFTLDRIHLIGFDLGAHVCGAAAREFKTGRDRIAKITGLNPSRINFGALSEDDALWVEVIFTDIFQNGISTPIGLINMYINRGRNQPGCGTNHLCSHSRAIDIMVQSIRNSNRLMGKRCNDIREVERNTCNGLSELPVGTLDLEKRGSGIFRVST